MDVLISETYWALYKEIIKQVTSSSSLFTQQSLELYFYYLSGHLWPVTERAVPLGTSQIAVIWTVSTETGTSFLWWSCTVDITLCNGCSSGPVRIKDLKNNLPVPPVFYLEDGGSRFIRNISIYLPNYVASRLFNTLIYLAQMRRLKM